MATEILGDLKDFPEGRGTIVEVAGRTLAVFNVKDTLYVLDNACRHRQGPLGAGTLTDTTITCPLHAWQYDVRTGKLLLDPKVSVQTHTVTVEGEKVSVEL